MSKKNKTIVVIKEVKSKKTLGEKVANRALKVGVGAVVGAVVGTLIAPGLGTLAGAKVGAKFGFQ